MIDLRALRERAGLSQTDAAIVAGIDKRTLQRYERGERRATPGVARWLHWVYGREIKRRERA